MSNILLSRNYTMDMIKKGIFVSKNNSTTDAFYSCIKSSEAIRELQSMICFIITQQKFIGMVTLEYLEAGKDDFKKQFYNHTSWFNNKTSASTTTISKHQI